MEPTTPLPAVSVIIPTRNRSGQVVEAVASALSQEGVEVEVIIVDDGSVDDTPTVLAAIEDARVSVIRRDGDHGEPNARNAGAEAASHEWIAFLDDDDRWAATKLRTQLRALLASSGASWSITSARIVDVDGRMVRRRSTERIARAYAHGAGLRLFLTSNQVPGPGSTLLVRRSVFESIGRFDPAVPLFADWDLYIRLAADSDPVLIDEALVDYVQHAGQMTADLSPGWEALAEFRLRYQDERTAADVRTADESVLLWVASRQLRSEGLRAVVEQLRRAGLVRSPGDVMRLSRTIASIARERFR